jgi:RHS repeat-associated protein
MRYVRPLVLMFALSVTAFAAGSASAQDDPNFEIGLKPYGSYNEGNIDTVNIGNGALSVNIPLMSYPQRGGKLKLDFSLVYFNGSSYSDKVCYTEDGYQECVWQPNWTPSGFAIVDKQAFSTLPQLVSTYNICSVYNQYMLACSPQISDSGGAVHVYAPLNTASTLYRTVDATGIQINGTSVIDSQGIVHTGITSHGPDSREDSNGNEITYVAGTGWTDTLGRTIPQVPQPTSNVANCPQPPTVPIAPSSAATWNLPGLDGGTYSLTFCYAAQNFTWGGNSEEGLPSEPYSPTELTSVVLPNGTAWLFQYNVAPSSTVPLANLSQITFPTGGTLSYSWGVGDVCSSHMIVANNAVLTRTLSPNDGLTPASTWTYNGWTVTDPAGNASVHTFGVAGPPGTANGCLLYENQVKYYQGSPSGTLLKTTNTTYYYTNTGWPEPSTYYGQPGLNVVPTSETTIWPNGQQRVVDYGYDSGFTFYPPWYSNSMVLETDEGTGTGIYGKQLTKKEYDYGGSLLRTTTTSYLALSNSTYLSYNLLDLPLSVQITDGGGTQRAYTTYSYDGSSPVSSGITTQHVTPPNGNYRGNLTSTAHWLSTTGTYLTGTNTNFDTGMVDVAKDPNLNPTTHGYSATYVGAFPTTITNALNQVTTNVYDFNTGLLTSTTDPNGQPTSYKYDDMLRTTQINYPDTGQTNFTYPTPNDVDITELNNYGAPNRLSYLVVDGVGRTIRQAVTNGESIPYDEADTCYDGLGRVSFKSYPFQDSGPFTTSRSCGSPELGDSSAYDALNRTTSVTHSDGSTVNTSYTGRATSVQDEGNGTQRVQRISQVDGLNRLASVCEVTSTTLAVGITGSTAPAACGQDIAATGFLTTYAYDALDDLTSVAQGPLNARTFVYDSLSRLTSSANPEAGTTTYTYDADGNVLTKKDARSITTTNAYDALNRVTSKTYSDGTPTVSFYYDQSSVWGVNLGSSIGRLTSNNVWNGSWVSGEIFAYDSMGRVINNSQCTPQNCSGTPFSVAYTYDQLGDITSSTPGEGMTLTNTYNAGARLTSVTSSISDLNHPGTLFGYQNLAHYNAAGSLTSVTLGNNVNETRTYDARLRLTGITDAAVYSVTIPTSGGYAPNSDILTAYDSVNGNWTYGYDAFNRLVGSNQNSGTTTYSYSDDRFGNRWNQTVTHGTGTPSSLGFDANNHITGSGVSYDLAGDMTYDGTTTYTYDAEGRVKTANNGISGSSSYAYDAEGRRIEKTTSAGGTVDFVYDLAGHEITQNSAGSWMRSEFYAGGRHVATYYGGTTYFIHPDWLGTERARSNVSGALCESITSLPYGDAMTTSGSCGDPSPMHFTGKEHDTETGLENFGARYDSSSMGRFMTPDWSRFASASVPYADFGDPQTLNLYSYVRNNSTSFVDRDGHNCDPDTSFTDDQGKLHIIAGQCHSDFAFAVVGFFGGHHFIPRQVFRQWDPASYARQLAEKFTSGPLADKSKNFNDTLHRAYNAQTAKIIENYLEKTGKNAEELTKEDFKEIVQEMKAAGGAIEEFSGRLESDVSSELRDIDEGLQAAVNFVEDTGGQIIEACEGGAPCLP